LRAGGALAELRRRKRKHRHHGPSRKNQAIPHWKSLLGSGFIG
jgi:hypothetical protein